MSPARAKWPKRLPELTPEQVRIRDEFMALWHDVLPARFGLIERFNHRYPLRSRRPRGTRTLEVGAGIGGHLPYEDLSAQDYVAMELRPEMAESIRRRHPACRVVVGDCQRRIPFEDASFDRVLAIHVLEHLPDLPAALREVRRVIKADGVLSVVIPCEGGLFYTFCRNVSARRIFEKRFRQSYDWCIASEHVNVPEEILEELSSAFRVEHSSYFPFALPVQGVNLCIGLTLRPR
jgi:ubiquinone/menaquinone biosynthesis C-methylase UbiE